MNIRSCRFSLNNTLLAVSVTIGLLPLSASAVHAAPPPHHHYKLIVLGTLGGPQSYGDAGHGAANINNRGIAAGNADTNIADRFYPNFNPLLTGGLIQSYPFVFHAFTSNGGALKDLGSLPGANSSTPHHRQRTDCRTVVDREHRSAHDMAADERRSLGERTDH